MSEWHNFISIMKASKSDAAVLLTTFFLTVLIDLTIAIEIGMILAAFLFMRNMMKSSFVEQLNITSNDRDEDLNKYKLPNKVDVFEINGPLFFGAAYKFKDAMKQIEEPAEILIIRMKNVPVIDATGIHILKDVCREIKVNGTKLILTEINSEQVMTELRKTRLLFQIGKANVTGTFEKAVQRSNEVLLDKSRRP